MTREEAIEEVKSYDNYPTGLSKECRDYIIKALEQEPTTKNDLGVDTNKLLADCEKMSFDIEIFNKPLKVVALDAVKNIAKDLINSENPNKSEILTGSTTKNDLGVDAISREQAINEFCIYNSYDSIGVDKVRSYLKALPSVTPQEPRCKDCKWWKDSDGEYRRGCGAESKCPINTKTVYLGKGYCYKFEPQESEDKE